MENIIFEKILHKRLELIRSVLGDKAKEYALGGDRLHNFRVAARMRNTSVPAAIEGMRLKHEVSTVDLVNFPELRTEDLILEKIGDNINYLILLEAALLESIDAAE